MPARGVQNKSVLPDSLRVYNFHGVDLNWADGVREAKGDCPFCNKEGKFSVTQETGLWHCWSCSQGKLDQRGEKSQGNALDFLRRLWRESFKRTKEEDYLTLAKERKLLHADTPRQWGAARSLASGNWIVPGWTADGRLKQLYRYTRIKKGNGDWVWCLLPGPGLSSREEDLQHGLFRIGSELGGILQDSVRKVYLCEGVWDGMALWECLAALDGNASNSSKSTWAVLAVPGCKIFSKFWTSLFSKKSVYLLFDNDHPQPLREVGDGLWGMKLVTQLLHGSGKPPEEIHYLAWGGKDLLHDASLPHGFDVRDWLTGRSIDGSPSAKDSNSPPLDKRLEALNSLKRRIAPVPSDWLSGAHNRVLDSDLLHCSSWNQLILAWRKAFKWTPGLDRALSVMLAAAASTKGVGDQLWVKIIGPPSCGKSVLCEALTACRRYVVAKSHIRGFHSGFGEAGAGASAGAGSKGKKKGKARNSSSNPQATDKDSHGGSLIPLLRDKTLVTKDGDTLLQSPNLGQILSEARDLYDGSSRAHYRNRVSMDHSGVRMTWILCGTESLRLLDTSELGERFLDCVIVDQMDADLEREIGWRVALRAARELSSPSDGTLRSQDAPELADAKALTGGYLAWLRDVGYYKVLPTITISDEAERTCQLLGEFVSFMRSRPSVKQEEKAQREMSFRLIAQHVRLALCLALVLNRSIVDDEVMSRVRQVALDTARGRVLDLCRHLHQSGTTGETMDRLASLVDTPVDKLSVDLRFLKKIGVIRSFRSRQGDPIRWALTERLLSLFQKVYVNRRQGGIV